MFRRKSKSTNDLSKKDKTPDDESIRSSKRQSAKIDHLDVIKESIKSIRQEVEKFDGMRGDDSYNHYQSVLTNFSQQLQSISLSGKKKQTKECGVLQKEINNCLKILEDRVESKLDLNTVESHSFINTKVKKKEEVRNVDFWDSLSGRRKKPAQAIDTRELIDLEDKVYKLGDEIQLAIDIEDKRQFFVFERKIQLLYADLEMLKIEPYSELYERKDMVGRLLVKFNNKLNKAKKNLDRKSKSDFLDVYPSPAIEQIAKIQAHLEKLETTAMIFKGDKDSDDYQKIKETLNDYWLKINEFSDENEDIRKAKQFTVEKIKSIVHVLNDKADTETSIERQMIELEGIRREVKKVTDALSNWDGETNKEKLDQILRKQWDNINGVQEVHHQITIEKNGLIEDIQKALRSMSSLPDKEQLDDFKKMYRKLRDEVDDFQDLWKKISKDITDSRLKKSDRKVLISELEDLQEKILKKLWEVRKDDKAESFRKSRDDERYRRSVSTDLDEVFFKYDKEFPGEMKDVKNGIDSNGKNKDITNYSHSSIEKSEDFSNLKNGDFSNAKNEEFSNLKNENYLNLKNGDFSNLKNGDFANAKKENYSIAKKEGSSIAKKEDVSKAKIEDLNTKNQDFPVAKTEVQNINDGRPPLPKTDPPKDFASKIFGRYQQLSITPTDPKDPDNKKVSLTISVLENPSLTNTAGSRHSVLETTFENDSSVITVEKDKHPSLVRQRSFEQIKRESLNIDVTPRYPEPPIKFQDSTQSYKSIFQSSPTNSNQNSLVKSDKMNLSKDTKAKDSYDTKDKESKNKDDKDSKLAQEILDIIDRSKSPDGGTARRNTTSIQKSLDQIMNIDLIVQEMNKRSKNFNGTKKDKEYSDIQDALVHCLITLTNIDTKNKDNLKASKDEVMQQIKRIQEYMDQKAKENAEVQPNEMIEIKSIIEEAKVLKKAVDCFNGTYRSTQFIQIEDDLKKLLRKLEGLDVKKNEKLSVAKKQTGQKIEEYLKILDERSIKTDSFQYTQSNQPAQANDLRPSSQNQSAVSDSSQRTSYNVTPGSAYSKLEKIRNDLIVIKTGIEGFNGSYKDANYVNLVEGLLRCNEELHKLDPGPSKSMKTSIEQYKNYVKELSEYFEAKLDEV